MNCPHCSAPLSERGSFCKACGEQVRCMSCRALLEPDAVACVECGVKIAEIGTQTPTSTTPEAAAVPSRRNTLSFREDKKTMGKAAGNPQLAQVAKLNRNMPPERRATHANVHRNV